MTAATPTGVLVAYDGSPAARRALAHRWLLADGGAQITVVNVMAPPTVSARIPASAEARQEQRRVLEEAREFLRERGIEAATLAPIGAPAREILAAARERGADLIVVGRGRGRLPHLGSISGELVRRAPCDVLVVHSGPEHGPEGHGARA
jgi:nucleotide-binding universal stress UspA family protein